MCEVTDLFVLTLLILCSISDVQKKGVCTWILIAMSALFAVFRIVGPRELFLPTLVGAVVGFLFLFISWVSKEAIGYADSWLIILLGGYLGIRGIVLLLTVAFVLSGIYGLVGFVMHKLKRASTVPFIPFLTIGYIGAILL